MTPPSGGPGSAGRLRRFVRAAIGPVVVYLVLKTFVVEAFHIWPSGSMEKTLLINDFLFVNKALYGAEIPVVHRRLPAFRSPERHDIVVFESVTEPGLTVVKRVVGIPGDTLAMRENALYRNGAAEPEPYVERRFPDRDDADPRMLAWQRRYYVGGDPASYRPTLKNWGPIVVPPDSYFVMGDNRDDSFDSRYWGFLDREHIRGSPLFVYYSFDRDGVLPLPFLTAIRWGRLLTVPR